jgi:hypothetical protein
MPFLWLCVGFEFPSRGHAGSASYTWTVKGSKTGRDGKSVGSPAVVQIKGSASDREAGGDKTAN